MDAIQTPSRSRNWVGALRAFVDAPQVAVERCELCGTLIATRHPHLIDPASRRLACACAHCASAADLRTDGAWRRVPERVAVLPDFRLTDADWDALMIPIGLAFFFHSTIAGRTVAMYPGPAGVVESLLDLAIWDALAAANPSIDDLRADVEALLAYRIDGARRYYRVPIDRCFALAGTIRTQWHGLSGGSEVRESIARFFADIDAAAEGEVADA